MDNSKTTLLPCPFCREQPYPMQTQYDDGRITGRVLECKCGVFLNRNQTWFDDAHTRLITIEEMDANLTERWNRRAA